MNLDRSKTTEPQINKWYFISFFKAEWGGWGPGTSSPNPVQTAAFTHFQFFRGQQRETFGCGFSSHATMFGAMQYLHSRRTALPAASHDSFSRYVLTCAWQFVLKSSWFFFQVCSPGVGRAALKCQDIKCPVKKRYRNCNI